MKHHFLSAVSLILLAGCAGGDASVTYNLEMNVQEEAQVETLTEQTVRVIERRLERMGIELGKNYDVEQTASGTMLTVFAEEQEALDALTAELAAPFKLRIMAQAAEGQKADITVDGHGGFVEAGVTEDDLSWVEGRKELGKSTGEVELTFTEEGRAEMQTLFTRMVGKNIGLFVRDQLVSKLFVDTADVKDEIVIREIPTAELATVFSEDVNVGLHVKFTPVP